MADLLINRQDAYTTYGIRMGDNFLDEISIGAPMKDCVENKSRLENGKRVDVSNPKIDERDLTLSFTIEGKTPADYAQKKQAFMNMLKNVAVEIAVPALGIDVYRLNYQKTVSYALSLNRRFSKIAVKFNEPNPTDRTPKYQ